MRIIQLLATAIIYLQIVAGSNDKKQIVAGSDDKKEISSKNSAGNSKPLIPKSKSISFEFISAEKAAEKGRGNTSQRPPSPATPSSIEAFWGNYGEYLKESEKRRKALKNIKSIRCNPDGIKENELLISKVVTGKSDAYSKALGQLLEGLKTVSRETAEENYREVLGIWQQKYENKIQGICEEAAKKMSGIRIKMWGFYYPQGLQTADYEGKEYTNFLEIGKCVHEYSGDQKEDLAHLKVLVKGNGNKFYFLLAVPNFKSYATVVYWDGKTVFGW